MFCPGWQIDAGCFVRGGKKWHGMFCPGMFCPTFVQLQLVITYKVSYSLDPDKALTEYRPDLGPNCLQRVISR